MQRRDVTGGAEASRVAVTHQTHADKNSKLENDGRTGWRTFSAFSRFQVFRHRQDVFPVAGIDCLRDRLPSGC